MARTAEDSGTTKTKAKMPFYEGIVTQALLKHVAGIAELSNASAILVYVDALEEHPLPLPDGLRPKVIYITRTVSEDLVQDQQGLRFLRVPNVPLSRLGQVNTVVRDSGFHYQWFILPFRPSAHPKRLTSRAS